MVNQKVTIKVHYNKIQKCGNILNLLQIVESNSFFPINYLLSYSYFFLY